MPLASHAPYVTPTTQPKVSRSQTTSSSETAAPPVVIASTRPPRRGRNLALTMASTCSGRRCLPLASLLASASTWWSMRVYCACSDAQTRGTPPSSVGRATRTSSHSVATSPE